jgi:hypothetical protein
VALDEGSSTEMACARKSASPKMESSRVVRRSHAERFIRC